MTFNDGSNGTNGSNNEWNFYELLQGRTFVHFVEIWAIHEKKKRKHEQQQQK